eukprot:241282_1
MLASKVQIAIKRIPLKPMNSLYMSVISFSIKSQDQTKNAGQRLLDLIDLWEDKPVGMFNQMYNARSRIAFRDFFDDGMSTAEATEYAKNYIKMSAYICGKDGVSDIEKNMMVEQMLCWCPHIAREELEDLCDVGEFEVAVICEEMNRTELPEARTTLLLNALSFAASDGLDSSEIEGFYDIADKLGVSSET